MYKDEFDIQCLDYILTSDALTNDEKICIEDSLMERVRCNECDSSQCEKGYTSVSWNNCIDIMDIKMTVSHITYTAGIIITAMKYLKIVLLSVVDGEIKHTIQYSSL